MVIIQKSERDEGGLMILPAPNPPTSGISKKAKNELMEVDVPFFSEG